jgi:hypothetical protein
MTLQHQQSYTITRHCELLRRNIQVGTEHEFLIWFVTPDFAMTQR